MLKIQHPNPAWLKALALIRRPRPAIAYATVAALTVVLFIALHVAGNRLPYDLAAERLAEEFRAAPHGNWGTRQALWFSPATFLWHYCEFGAGVLAGARGGEHHDAVLRDAVLLRSVPDGSYACERLQAAVLHGVRLPSGYLNVRHWWGGKALYAIGLRHLTVRQFHMAVEALVYCGFLSLAVALLLIGWRTLLIGAPLLLFGLFSGMEFFGTLATGLPFAWALLTPALGAELLRRDRQSVAKLFFFFAGMIAHYLWLFGGANFVAATAIGLVAWLARGADSPRQRIARAAVCVGVYTAGFVVSLASRLALASAMGAWTEIAERSAVLAGRIWSPEESRDMVARDYATYSDIAGMDAPTFTWWTLAAAAALLLAALIAGYYHAWRRRPALLFGVLWFVALCLPFCLHMLLPQDHPSRAARLMFLPLGLAFCCLIAVLIKLPRWQIAAWSAGIGIVLALSYVGVHLHYSRQHEAKIAHARVLSASMEDGAFAVYLLDPAADGASRPNTAPERELIYRKSPCDATDIRYGQSFFLHAFAPAAILPSAKARQLGFVNLDFPFYANGQIFMGTCHASVRLPGYAQGFRTGQTRQEDWQGLKWKNLWHVEIPKM